MFNFIRHSLNIFLLAVTLTAIGWGAAWKLAGAHALSVQSGSMAPAIKKGDLIIDLKPKTVQSGEVVTYRSQTHPGEQVTHRIASTDPVHQTLITKGDGLKTADPQITAGQITGKVFKVIPKAGYVYDWVHTPVGLLIAVYLPLILIVVTELWSLAGQMNYRSYNLLKTS